MKISRIELNHFRNYRHLLLEFNQGLTILTGENAQGKTNLLEAIFLLSLAKSHRTNQDQDLIEWGQTEAKIQAEIETNHINFPLELKISSKGKIAKFNHVEQDRLSSFIGKLNVILFAPEDLQLIKGSPGLRRKFIDAELGQAHPVYLQSLLKYNTILKQRNKYLKDFGFSQKFDDLYFQVLTQQLIDEAILIINYRLDFINNLEKLALPIHETLSNHKDHLSFYYKSCHSKLDYQNSEKIKESFIDLFQDNIQREKERGITLYGPHRDDLEILIDEKPAAFFGSQGQQRTIILSIKLAEIELLYRLTNEYPILLLDDVLSELDDYRKHILMSHIEGKVQTFLTTATIKGLNLDLLTNANVLMVNQGQIIDNKGASTSD